MDLDNQDSQDILDRVKDILLDSQEGSQGTLCTQAHY